MLKKPSVILAFYSNLQVFCCPHTGLATPSFPYQASPKPKVPERQKQQFRSYATVRPDKATSDTPDDLFWPRTSTSTIPTPYQIFHISPRDKYSKHRFYALVKIYHPDRSGHAHIHADIHRLPGAVKMERYRLIVAANDILSDPDKRKAYDRTGAGWHGRMEHSIHPSQYNWSQASGETRWSGFDTNDSPFRNATWEDWERWYRRHEKQEAAHTSNGGFLSLVVVAVVLGAVGQTGQVSRHNALFKEQLEVKHEKATKMLMSHQQDSHKIGDRDHQLQKFLKERDIGAPMGLGNARDAREDRKLFPQPVVCMSGMQQQRPAKGRRRDEDAHDNG